MSAAVRPYLYWLGPILGLATAALWGGATAGWLLLGAAIGYASEMAARRFSAAEPTSLDQSIAFFLVAQTSLTLIPFLAVAGVLPDHAGTPGPVRALDFLLIPAGAALMAWLQRWALVRSRDAGAWRRRPKWPPPGELDRWLWIFLTLLLVVGLGLGDSHMPPPYSLEFLYLLPIFAVSWRVGQWGGMIVAAFAAEVRGIARGLTYPGELSALLGLTDSLLLAAGLATVAILLARLKAVLELERAAARADLLTGLKNRKAFREQVEHEVSRAERYRRPLSIAYLDLDGFKAVNDRHGHAAGDEVLRIVAGVLRTSLRTHDLAARLGGDEFGVVLPETDASVAAGVMERLRREVEDRMHAFGWPVTCSVGVVTSAAARASADELVRRADELMYEVKHGGKNALRQAILVAD